jgi:hypothetical protein
MSRKHLAGPLGVLMLVVVVCVGLWCGRPDLPPVKADEPAKADAPADPGKVDVYDADKDHLWNRLHAALFVRLTTARGPNEELVPQDRPENHAYGLDPMLWHQSRYLLTGPGHKPAVAVLDEFLDKNAEKLIKDPLKRALLQRDLWALFDSVLADPAWFDYTNFDRTKKDPYKAERAELATRVVKVMRRLALTREQIDALPDNYAAAVAAKTFPTAFDTGKEDKAFLPPDLWQPQGSWVLLGDKLGRPLAQTHLEFFGGRSAFFVFLRLPEGRDATCQYLGELRGWARDGRKGDPPQLPFGTSVALARQTVLIDDKGEMRETHLTESVQIRAFRCTDKAAFANAKVSTENRFEIKLRRKDLLAAKAGGLYAVKDDESERALLLFMGINAGEGNEVVMTSCSSCHQGAGLESVNSFTRRFDRYAGKPDLTASTRSGEALKFWGWKRRQITWGLLNWLRED